MDYSLPAHVGSLSWAFISQLLNQFRGPGGRSGTKDHLRREAARSAAFSRFLANHGARAVQPWSENFFAQARHPGDNLHHGAHRDGGIGIDKDAATADVPRHSLPLVPPPVLAYPLQLGRSCNPKPWPPISPLLTVFGYAIAPAAIRLLSHCSHTHCATRTRSS